jgi:uncharacterized protein YqgQ
MKTNLEKYFLSIKPVMGMFNEGILSKSDFIKAESFIADKYCINKNNLYRLNNLTKPPKQVIYSVSKKEVKDETKEDNETRIITKIG